MRSWLRRGAWWAAQVPGLRRLVVAYYEHASADGWSRRHPYDREHGIETSGMLPGFVVRAGDPLDAETTAYLGSQPSIVLRALREIPEPERCTFLDLGCGKGRPLVVASELSFAAILGVELSAEVAAKARRNAAIIARAHPARTRIAVVTGDALAYPLPPAPLVIFLYHPFVRELTAQLLRAIEASLAARPRPLYVVSYNPVYADLFDGSPALARRFAASIPYAPGEVGYGPDADDSVVIWQDRATPREAPPASAARAVRVTIPDLRADVVE